MDRTFSKRVPGSARNKVGQDLSGIYETESKRLCSRCRCPTGSHLSDHKTGPDRKKHRRKKAGDPVGGNGLYPGPCQTCCGSVLCLWCIQTISLVPVKRGNL